MDAPLCFDREAALVRVDGDKAFLLELIDLMFAQFAEILPVMKDAYKTGAAARLQGSAHQIKGALGNVGAMICYAVAYKLELAGRNNDLAPVQGLFSELDQAMGSFRTEIEKFRAE